MRYFAIFIFLLLTERSFGKRCCKSCCSNITVDINALRAIYRKAINRIMVPTLEVGDQWAANFKDRSTQAVLGYAVQLTKNLHTQAIEAGYKLIDDIERDEYRLKRLIRLIAAHDAKPTCLEKALKKLTNQVWVFLKLKPGINTTECPVLPELPPEPVEFESRTTKKTAEEIFLNFDLTVFSVFRQIYGYLAHIYLASWRGVMSVYEILRMQFYEEILNCPVMCAYRQVVDEVCKNSNLIRYYVSPEAWQHFEDAHDRTVKISNDYCDSLKHKGDCAQTIPKSNHSYGNIEL